MIEVTLPLKSNEGFNLAFIYDEAKLKEIMGLYMILRENNILNLYDKEVLHSCLLDGAVSSTNNAVDLLSRKIRRPVSQSDYMIYNHGKMPSHLKGSSIFVDKQHLRTVWDILSNKAIDYPVESPLFRDEPIQIVVKEGHVREGLTDTLLESYIDQLFEYVKHSDDNTWLKSIVLHFCLEYWLPFSDGNGRLSRYVTREFLTSRLEYSIYLPINAVIFGCRNDYISTVDIGKKHSDISSFVDYMLGVYIISFYIALYVSAKDELGQFLSNRKDRYLTDVDLKMRQLLLNNDLLDSVDTIKPNLLTAIQIYNKHLW